MSTAYVCGSTRNYGFKFFIICGLLCWVPWFPLWAGVVSGVVLDGAGDPVERVDVLFLDADSLCEVGSQKTDASGYFFVDLPNGSYVARYTGPGILKRYVGHLEAYNLARAEVIEVDDGDVRLDFQVSRAASLSGRIRLEGRIPDVFELSVVVYNAMDELAASAEVERGEDGYFYFKAGGLIPGCYKIAPFFDDGYGRWVEPNGFWGGDSGEQAGIITLREGESVSNLELPVTLAGYGEIRVELTEQQKESGPILTLEGDGWEAFYVSFFQDGVAVARVPPGLYRVVLSFSKNNFPAIQSGVRVVTDQTTELQFETQAGGTIEGQLLWPEGVSTQTRLRVAAYDAETLRKVKSATVTLSGASADYSMSGIPDGEYMIKVWPSFNENTSLSGIYQGEGGEYTMRLEGGGTLVDRDVHLTVGATLNGQLIYDDQPLNSRRQAVEAVHQDTGLVFFGEYGRHDENYVISAVPPGRYKVGVAIGSDIEDRMVYNLFSGCVNLGPSYLKSEGLPDEDRILELNSGDVLSSLNIEVEPGGVITGRLQSQNSGCSVSGGWVGAFLGETLVEVAAVEQGFFEIGGLGPGAYTLRWVQTFGLVFRPYGPWIISFPSAHVFPESVISASGAVGDIGVWSLPLVETGQWEALLPATHLLYPWISNKTSQFESVLIVNNYGDQEAEVTLTARRSAAETEEVTVKIPAHGFIDSSAASLFRKLGSGAGYSVTLISASEKIRGSWVTNSLASPSKASPSQGVAVQIPTDGNGPGGRIGEEILFGHVPVGQDAIAAQVLVNTGPWPTDITLKYVTKSGQLAGLHTFEAVEPFIPLAVLASDLVTGDEDVYMIAQGEEDLVTGVSFVFDQQFREPAIGNVSAIETGADDRGATSLSYPWVSNRDGLFESTMVLVNYGGATAHLRLVAHREDGSVSEPVDRSVPPGGALVEKASHLFPDLGSGGGYNVNLYASSSKVRGSWLTHNLAAESGRSPSQGVAVGVSGERDRKRNGNALLFGYLPLEGSYVSAPVIVNTGNQPAPATFTYYNGEGQVLAEVEVDALEPGRPYVGRLGEHLPGHEGNVGLVVVCETQTITGVGFVFNGKYNEPAIGNATVIKL